MSTIQAPIRAWCPLVAALQCVDYVVVFDDSTAAPVLRDLRPHVQCKGTDYSEETVPERDVMKSLGGTVCIVGDAKEHSTREIMGRIVERSRNR